MSKRLIIAEKPSVAQDIARALGGFTRTQNHYESDEFILTSAIGHLLELAVPPEHEVKRGKWSFAHLPVIPPQFALNPIAKTEDQLKLLERLIKRREVTGLVNACDAGREGELIFHYIVQHSGTKKPIERLWLQSMTKDAIRTGFAHLLPGTDKEGLREAAVSRAESDWLVGINGTRAITAFNSKTGGFHLTTVGRVQTPTLTIMVEREEKIRHFVARDYWELEALFAGKHGRYSGKWFDPNFRKGEDEHANDSRIWDTARAEALQQKCTGKPGRVEEQSKPENRLSPGLYDLTTLQREANNRFGFSARTTLQIAQALYERHKVLTYPRTDSRHLPEDTLGMVKDTLRQLPEGYAAHADNILANGWVKPNKRIFDNKKVSDHFAIIPTGNAPKSLSEAEHKIFDLVTRRFLAVFFPAAEYLVTTRITHVEGETFKSEGKVLKSAGWLAVYGKGDDTDDNAVMAAVAQNEIVATETVQLKTSQTRPPARFNDATLLSAMEGAGKMVEDDALREAMKERGLGTPATRAQIIENLILEAYLLREGKDLMPTAKAFSLITLLRGLGIGALTAPELTGEWEYKLSQVAAGKLSRQAFMDGIATLTRDIVERAKAYESDTVPGDFATLTVPCPQCGGTVNENYKKFACQSCAWETWKIVAGRQFEIGEIEVLLRDGSIGPLTGFRNKMGRPFEAVIRLNDDKLPAFDFGNDRDDAAEIDFSGQKPLGACPKCQSPIYETETAYVCSKAVGAEKSCDFRSGKTILQQEIAREQMQKLLAEGKTDLFKGFVSARTRRAFEAFLVLEKDAKGGAKVGFEFPPRDTRKARNRASASASAKRELGAHPTDGQPVVLHETGRFGPYVSHGKLNASLPRDRAPDTMTLEDAIALLVARSEKPTTRRKKS
jgi:DNA topoisomerase-3